MITFETNSTDPYFNLAFEEFVFTHYSGEEDIFYLWQNSSAVVVGNYQNICREINLPTVNRKNIPVLRRFSGGGTVYHDLGNINYTYIHQAEFVDYDKCLKVMIDGLNKLGIKAEKGGICDIMLDGKKISGSAQKKTRTHALHHGTLLYDTDIEQLDYITTKQKNDCFHSKSTVSAICKVRNIKEYLDESTDITSFKGKLEKSILGSEFQQIKLAEDEIEKIQRLADEKYRTFHWTWERNPQFSYERTGDIAGEEGTVSYRVEKGIITEFKMNASNVDEGKIKELLEGKRFEVAVIEDACKMVCEKNHQELFEFLL